MAKKKQQRNADGDSRQIERIVMPCCKTCKHWKNKQAELEYNKRMGICTCYKWKFTTNNYEDIALLDRANRSDKFMGIRRFESQLNEVPFGKVEPSNYCFVTEEGFCCIHHSKA